MTVERQTAAEVLIVAMLCQGFDNDPVGPRAWTCRRAWFTLSMGQPFDFDSEIAEHNDWLDKPENAKERENLAARVEFIRKVAAKAPFWPLPDDLLDGAP